MSSNTQPITPQISRTPWRAHIELGFEHRANKTYLTHRKHSGPLRVQKPLYPEGDQTCHVLILHPPAGIASGDALTIDVSLKPNSHALLTTPGAGKWYGGDSLATQHITLHVDDHAFLEWVPQEVIVFDHSHVKSNTTIFLAKQAALFAWEMTVFGRKDFMEQYLQGQYHNQVTIYREDELLLQDKLCVSGDDRWFYSPLGLNGNHVMATAWAIAPNHHNETLEKDIEALRVWLSEQDNTSANMYLTRLNNVLVARCIGANVRDIFERMAQIRAWLRQRWFNNTAHYPRIWQT